MPNVDQPPQVILTLRILYALVPCICNAAAFIVLLAYPISRGIHEEIRTAIKERNEGKAVADPLHPGRLVNG
jgi:GPH family glycoside/pentoside/hexuronide:cation symporter